MSPRLPLLALDHKRAKHLSAGSPNWRQILTSLQFPKGLHVNLIAPWSELDTYDAIVDTIAGSKYAQLLCSLSSSISSIILSFARYISPLQEARVSSSEEGRCKSARSLSVASVMPTACKRSREIIHSKLMYSRLQIISEWGNKWTYIRQNKICPLEIRV